MRIDQGLSISLSVLLSLTACQARYEGDSVAVEEQNEAENITSACAPVIFEDTSLTHCTADPALHAIRLVHANGDGEAYRSFASYAGARPADASPVVFAVNGGKFDEDGDPIGYYVEDGERLQTLNRSEGDGDFYLKPNGVFFGNASESWRVWETERFFSNVFERPDFGTQSGPMLIVAGELHEQIVPEDDTLAIRNGVGIDAAGRAHFVISEEPISLERFARYYRDVIGTANALYLDGDASQLWDPTRARMDYRAAMGPMIVVEMRENSQ